MRVQLTSPAYIGLQSVSLTLPFQPLPLSACFVNRKGGGRHESKAYAAWKRDADEHLARFHGYALGAPNRPTVPGHVKVGVFVRRPDNRRRDLDNILKATLDLLVRNYVIDDDSKIVDLHVMWSHPDMKHATVIEVERATYVPLQGEAA